jgi:hypothetical protein
MLVELACSAQHILPFDVLSKPFTCIIDDVSTKLVPLLLLL